MKNKKDRKKFLDTLRDFPIVSVAAKRSGIDKSQIYRWRKKDKEFSDEMDKCLIQGRDSINDLAESQVISAIRNGNERMTKFWLENNCKRYVKPRPVTYIGNTFGADKQVVGNTITFKRMDGEMHDAEEEERLNKITEIKERFAQHGGIPLKPDGTKIEDDELIRYEGYIEECYKKGGKLFMEGDDYIFFEDYDGGEKESTDTHNPESSTDEHTETLKENTQTNTTS